MNKFCKRLRYSVGGTYRLCGPGKSLSVDKGSSRFFFVFTSSSFSTDGFLLILLSAARFTPIMI